MAYITNEDGKKVFRISWKTAYTPEELLRFIDDILEWYNIRRVKHGKDPALLNHGYRFAYKKAIKIPDKKHLLPPFNDDPDDGFLALKGWLTNEILAREQASNKTSKPPLTKRTYKIYEKLCSLEQGQAMTTPDIQEWWYKETGKQLDEGEFKRIRRALKPYGMKNMPKVGYYIKK
jgi:hypothetical protein